MCGYAAVNREKRRELVVAASLLFKYLLVTGFT